MDSDSFSNDSFSQSDYLEEINDWKNAQIIDWYTGVK